MGPLFNSCLQQHCSERLEQIAVLPWKDGAEVELKAAVDNAAVDGRTGSDAELAGDLVEIVPIWWDEA